ncbi:MAG: DUF1499 domain-containing protein [Ectothiorhodospiraceae bacterium]|jgi:hypothetical protein
MSFGSLLKPLLALILLAVGAVVVAIAFNRPPLLDSPGILVRVGTYLTTNTVETSPVSAYPERKTPVYNRPPGAVLDAALAAVKAQGWEVSKVDREQRYIHAVASTPVWGFKDDVEIRVSPAPGDRSEVYIRSASRIGVGDLGANTRRLVTLRNEIPERL